MRVVSHSCAFLEFWNISIESDKSKVLNYNMNHIFIE